MKGRKHKHKRIKPMNYTATTTDTVVTNPDYHFVVTVSDGTTYSDQQVAPDGATARAQAVAKLNAIIASINADQTA